MSTISTLFRERWIIPKTPATAKVSELKQYNIQFCRVMWGAFWPSGDKLYFEDKNAYFKLMDGVVKSAEENGVGLIPSLFWNQSTVPDLVGEPMNQWGNPNSKTIAFMQNYVKEVVTRYKNSPAIWGWEFGNEFNLGSDLPNASEHRPGTWTVLSCPATRSEKDDYTHAITRTAYNEFAKAVRKYDTYRFIEGGDGFPRNNAWNGMTHNTWDMDTEKQYAEMITNDCPDPMTALSGHQYDVIEDRCGRKMPVEEFFRMSIEIGKAVKKPLFVGEFGANEETGADKAKATFTTLLDGIEKSGVPLSCLWVFDLHGYGENLDHHCDERLDTSWT